METKPTHVKEAEFSGPLWKHPYFLYILITIVLFGLLVLLAWLAVENDWVPKRNL